MSALPLLLDLAVKGTAVLLAAFVVTLMMRRASAAARHAVWTLTLAGLLLLPALALLPGWTLPFGMTSPFTPVASVLPGDDVAPDTLPAFAQARPTTAESSKTDVAPDR